MTLSQGGHDGFFVGEILTASHRRPPVLQCDSCWCYRTRARSKCERAVNRFYSNFRAVLLRQHEVLCEVYETFDQGIECELMSIAHVSYNMSNSYFSR